MTAEDWTAIGTCVLAGTTLSAFGTWVVRTIKKWIKEQTDQSVPPAVKKALGGEGMTVNAEKV